MTDRFDELYDEVTQLVDNLWAHPELGYREQRTSAAVRAFIERHLPAPRSSPSPEPACGSGSGPATSRRLPW